MEILNLIGLVLGYLGSILLSVGFIKSKQEVVDEETPFWGPNPFKMRSTLRTRMLGFAGVASLVAGFATTTVATAFRTVLNIDSVNLAILAILLLITAAYLVISLALSAKKRAHLHAKSHYYFDELVSTVRELKDGYLKQPVETTKDHTFEELKKQNMQRLSKYNIDLNAEDKKTLGKLIGAIEKAEKFADIEVALNDFLSQQDDSKK